MVVGQSPNVMQAGRAVSLAVDVRQRSRSTPDRSNDRLRGLLVVALLWHSALLVYADDVSLDTESITAAIESIRVEDLKTHVNTLASDAMQGRECGTTGGHAASAYLVQQLRKCGVAPAAPGRQFVQEFSGGLRNILACISGRDHRLTDEAVLLCAHFDHVGFGTTRNSRGPIGYIHNGADDNASGVAALLEVIEAMKSLAHPPRRTVLFAFWDGEEKGLLGSKHWITAPTLPLAQIKLVINADMIGRLRAEGVEITGVRSARGLRHLLSDANSSEFVVPPLDGSDDPRSRSRETSDAAARTLTSSATPAIPPEGGATNPLSPRLPLDFTWDMRADSDHHPFFAAGIPALMLHTGKHDDYHRPSDDADKLNYEGTQRLARLMLSLALRAAEADELPPFRIESRAETKEHQRRIEQPLPSPAPRLGITFNARLADQRVIEIAEVTPQSPAALAGFRVGDRILRFSGHAVSDVPDFRTLVVVADRDTSAIVQRPARAEPLELSVRLIGDPAPLGLSWRTDDAEPGSVILTQVIPHSPAALAGLKPLDRMRVTSERSTASEQLSRISTAPPLPITVTFERNGVIGTTSIAPITAATGTDKEYRARINARP